MKKFWHSFKALFVKGEKEKTALQKTALASIILCGLALIALFVYLVFLAPMMTEVQAGIPDLLEGEVYENNAIYILRKIDRSEIEVVTVKNDFGTYTLDAYTSDNGSRLFRFHDDNGQALDEEAVSTFLGDVRVLITTSPAGFDRVNDRATEADLAAYGLDASSDPAWFEVKLLDGTSYRILVGDALTTSSGYYAMLDGRKNTVTSGEDGQQTEYLVVYSLQSALGATVLAEDVSLLSKAITPSFGNDVYNMSDFSIARLDANGERQVIIRAGLSENAGVSASGSQYCMTYPKAYMLNEDVYNKMLSYLSSITADNIVAYGDRVHIPAVYEKYGLDLDEERLLSSTDKNHALLYFNCADKSLENYESYAYILYFSEIYTDISGAQYYYIYSPLREVVAKLSADKFVFIDWTIAKFTSEYLYYEYFTSTDYFEMSSVRDKVDLRLTLSGKEYNRRATATTAGENGTQLYVTNESGSRIPLIYDTKYKFGNYGVEFDGDFELVRDLYYVLITRRLALSAEIDESMTTVAETPCRTISAQSSPKDRPITYYLYSGTSKKQVRDQGGNILCTDVVTVIKRADGTETTITYDKAYYDPETKKMFLKAVDSNDSIEKPLSFTADSNSYVQVTTYLSENTTAQYSETVYTYEFYDLYDEYVNVDGETVRQLNATYTYMVPTKTTLTYEIKSGGARTLIDEKTERAETGVYVRTGLIDKLFSDADKLLAGKTIDTAGIN